MPRKKQPSLPDSGKVADGVRIRAYPSGKQRLEIQFQHRGEQCRELLALPITRPNIQYAINLKHQIEAAKDRNEFLYHEFFPDSPRCKLFGETQPTDPTVEEAITAWLHDAQTSYPHSTYRAYQKAAKQCINALGKIKLTELEREPNLIRDMIRNRKGTLKTIRNDLIPLRAVLDQSMQDDKIRRNPMDRIKVNKLANNRTTSTYTVEPLSPDEIRLFLDAAATYKPRWRNYFQFALYSGLRTSEIYALRWRDVDMKNNQVKVQSAIVERKEKTTKTTASTRRVDLLPMALSALLAEYNEATNYGKGREQHDHVFWNPVLKKPITDYEHSGRAWKYILDKAGLSYRNQYQTRHSYCSNMLSGGENLYYVAQQMGHADTEMVMKHYGKWIDQGQISQSQRRFVSSFGQIAPAPQPENTPDKNT